MVADARRLISWAQARSACAAGRLEEVSSFPEHDIAQATRTSLRDASRELERSQAITMMPAFGDALTHGSLTGAHVDLAGRAWRTLEPPLRPRLADAADRLVQAATVVGTDEFARLLRREVRRIEADDGMARLEQQQRNTRLRSWVDHDGMYHLAGCFDPVTGATLAGRLRTMVDTLFADTTPATAPTDPGARQDHLRALALVALTNGNGPRASRPEVVIIVDTTQPDDHDQPHIDWGIPVEIPLRILADLAPHADTHTIVLRNGVVLHAPGNLDLERSTRIANRAQRRALRALHPTCAIPGCTVHYNACKIHHITWWRHGGTTNLANLVPLCQHHHHTIHDQDWTITLDPDRTITVHLPDGGKLTNGPPRSNAA